MSNNKLSSGLQKKMSSGWKSLAKIKALIRKFPINLAGRSPANVFKDSIQQGNNMIQWGSTFVGISLVKKIFKKYATIV